MDRAKAKQQYINQFSNYSKSKGIPTGHIPAPYNPSNKLNHQPQWNHAPESQNSNFPEIQEIYRPQEQQYPQEPQGSNYHGYMEGGVFIPRNFGPSQDQDTGLAPPLDRNYQPLVQPNIRDDFTGENLGPQPRGYNPVWGQDDQDRHGFFNHDQPKHSRF